MLVAASPAAGQVRPTIPALWLEYGTMLTFDAWGILTTAATPGTGTWDIRMGSTVIWTSGSPTLTASMSSWKWHLHVDLCVRIEGATVAQAWGQGYLIEAASATTDSIIQLPYNTNPPVLGTAWDNTVPQVFDSFFTESLATATLVCEEARAVVWNPSY